MRCVISARISVSTEESVSIDRQIEACRKYAAARGWHIVGEPHVDRGVSATLTRPSSRAGWQALLATPGGFDYCLAWRVDRIARRTRDFLDADEAVKALGAKGIVTVDDGVDTTTVVGEATGTLLSVFSGMETAATRARVTAARAHLLAAGRWPGGRVPFGWMVIPNPDGKGKVVVQDPDRIKWVKAMADRTLEGRSVHSTAQWLTDQGVPTYEGCERWRSQVVSRIIRHPLVGGLIPANPGNKTRVRGGGVVMGDNGLRRVHDHLGVMPVSQWDAMVKGLDDPTVDPRRMPRAMRQTTNGRLSGLMVCADESHEPQRMWRGTRASVKGTSYSCPLCHQTLSNVEALVAAEFLRVVGDELHLDVIEEVVEGAAAEHAEISRRIGELGKELAGASAERFAEIMPEMMRLKEMQAEAAEIPSVTRWVQVGDGITRTFREDWERAEDDERRRGILGHALDRILVSRGRRGEWSDAAKLARMTFEWRPMGQTASPGDEVLAQWASA